MKNLLLLLTAILFASQAFSQEKWSVDRRLTQKPVQNYSKIVEDFVSVPENPNKTTRIYETQNERILVFPNIRVNPNSNQQDEIVLVRHPTNPLIMFGGANTTVSGVYGQGGYNTTNGGTSWFGTDLIPVFSQSSSDPGPVIDKDGRIIFTVLDPSMTAAYSTNNGTTWSPKVIITPLSSDKNFANSDKVPSSLYYGRTYCVWSNFQLSAPPIVVSYTTNGGTTWSAPFQINAPPGGHYSQGCDVEVGPAGQVYVCWAAPLSGGNFTEDYAGFARSSTGGVAWTVVENAYDMNGIRAGSYNGWGVRVNGFPRIAVDRTGGTRNGWIYVVASEVNLAPAGTDADVVMHRSTDGGVTWSAGIRVNQDPSNNGKVQFFPAINVDDNGGVNITYYDNRNYPSFGDSCETYLSRSTNGGSNWTDILVSDHRWRPRGEPGLGAYMGDYIGITSGIQSGNLIVWPFWFDFSTGSMQAWTSGVNINLLGVTNNNETPAEFSLSQNYPNPFNPSTTINYSIPKSGDVSLIVYDVLGKKIETLVEGVKPAGEYEVQFNAYHLPSGIYIYKLKTADLEDAKKMIVVK